MTSFVTAVPEMLVTAGGNLTAIGNSLGQATAGAAALTTMLPPAAADEVSAAIARLFGNYGNEFQALSAQAEAFHAEFSRLLDGSAATYVGAEIANASNGLLGGTGVAAAAAAGSSGSWSMFFSNTASNLGALLQAWSAHPFPVLSKVLANQMRYAELVGTAFSNAVTSFPAGLQVLPPQFAAALQSFAGFNPLAFTQWFLGKQAAYWQLFGSSISSALQQFSITIPVALSDLQMSVQQVALGNFTEGAYWYGRSLLDLWVTGFDTSQVTVNVLDTAGTASGPITLLGPAGSLLPLLSIPEMQLQDLAAILPAGSSVQHMAQNMANMVSVIADADISIAAGLAVNVLDPFSSTYYFNANFGLPLALGFGLLGSPVTLVGGMALTAQATGTALLSGDYLGAASILLNAPPTLVDAFFNGVVIADVAIPVGAGFPFTYWFYPIPPIPPFQVGGAVGFNSTIVVHVPFNGLLVPPHPVQASVSSVYIFGDLNGIPFAGDLPVNQTVNIGGTQFAGIVPMLVNTLPQSLAAAITPY